MAGIFRRLLDRSKMGATARVAASAVTVRGESDSGPASESKSFDLRDHGFSAPARDQGRSDRCAAYAVAGAAGCWNAVKGSTPTAFSEMELFERGDRQPDIQRMLDVGVKHGLLPDGAGPCSPRDCGRSGRCDAHSSVASRLEYRLLEPYPKPALRRQMREALWRGKQPLLVQARVSNSFRDWQGGRPYEPLERGTGRHALCIVGYRSEGEDERDGVWIIRNSYGVGWGDDGYFEAWYGDPNLLLETWVYALTAIHEPGGDT